MKRVAFSSVFSFLLVSLLSVNAFAEAIERPWKGAKGSTSAHGKTIFGKKIETEPTQEPPRIFIRKFNTTTAPKRSASQPVAAGKTKNPSKKIIAAKPLEILPPKVRKPRVKRASHKIRGKALWWKKTGNPAVFAFRDCAANYATSQVKSGKRDSAANFITASMKSSCQLKFAKMAGVLIGGLGEEKSNVILKELAQTTFLPTVQQAMAKLENGQPVQVAGPAGQSPKVLQTPTSQALASQTLAQNRKALIAVAKKQMFSCFIERTDRLSAARSTKANTIASAVIAGCERQSDAFFDNLFVNSKASPEVIRQQKNIALNDVYRRAIVKRILVTRGKAKLQTATGTSTSTSVVAPVQ